MKKRFFSILLSLCMVLMLCPVAAFAEEPERIDITLSGFEVGNTPADCAFTIVNSTLDDGISVGVSYICWYVNDTEGSHIMSNTAKFEPDTTYEVKFLTVSLTTQQNISSLTVTVNGKTTEVIRYGYDWGVHVVFDKLPALTIDGADVVCAQQDYKFTVTSADGVTVDDEAGYSTGGKSGSLDLTLDEDGVGHGVIRAEWFDPNSKGIDLSAYGWTADQKFVTAAKTVQVSPDHLFVDGVCGCGAKQQYIVQYDGGAEFGLQVAFKTHGVDLTLRGETFKRDGYVQTGWIDANNTEYALGGIYSTDADITLYPVWDELITLSVPFTTTVKLGGEAVPGETTFKLAIVGANADEARYADVTVSASVTTNGEGSYEGTMTLSGPSRQLNDMLCEGAFVQQVNEGKDGWTYDDTVWGLLLWQGAIEYSMDDTAAEDTVLILPVICEEAYDGVYYGLDLEAAPVDRMIFTNTYTKSAQPAENNPNTGDSSKLTLWFALLAVSAAGVIGADVYIKRRRSF